MKVKKLSKILVPVDGSKESICACKWACTVAEGTGAAIYLLYVIDLNLKMTSFDRVSMSGYVPGSIKKQGEELLADYRSHMPAELEINLLLETGSPHQTIVKIAEQTQPDWIIMGSRGASNIKEIVMGSVSQYVLHHVSCPVMIVKNDDKNLD